MFINTRVKVEREEVADVCWMNFNPQGPVRVVFSDRSDFADIYVFLKSHIIPWIPNSFVSANLHLYHMSKMLCSFFPYHHTNIQKAEINIYHFYPSTRRVIIGPTQKNLPAHSNRHPNIISVIKWAKHWNTFPCNLIHIHHNYASAVNATEGWC